LGHLLSTLQNKSLFIVAEHLELGIEVDIRAGSSLPTTSKPNTSSQFKTQLLSYLTSYPSFSLRTASQQRVNLHHPLTSLPEDVEL
jgi:hypothetical protein